MYTYNCIRLVWIFQEGRKILHLLQRSIRWTFIALLSVSWNSCIVRSIIRVTRTSIHSIGVLSNHHTVIKTKPYSIVRLVCIPNAVEMIRRVAIFYGISGAFFLLFNIVQTSPFEINKYLLHLSSKRIILVSKLGQFFFFFYIPLWIYNY